MNPLRRAYRAGLRVGVRAFEALGFNLAKTSDYYSPLPTRSEVLRNRARWDRPSELPGLRWELDAMKERLGDLARRFGSELEALPSYDETKRMGYGPGFTLHDSQFLYLVLRGVRPRRFVEIGSGLSTWWASQALERNRAEGHECEMIAVDPFARDRVRTIPGLEVRGEAVQDVSPDWFSCLAEGDVLFIDSTHVVKIDGDVPHLYLEVVPRLAPGVLIHAHDVHFPYNVPHPVQQNVVDGKWPRYWTEAMLLQAFLAFNNDFEIWLAPPMIRHHDEAFLASVLDGSIPGGYRPLAAPDYDSHFGSFWFKRVR